MIKSNLPLSLSWEYYTGNKFPSVDWWCAIPELEFGQNLSCNIYSIPGKCLNNKVLFYKLVASPLAFRGRREER